MKKTVRTTTKEEEETPSQRPRATPMLLPRKGGTATHMRSYHSTTLAIVKDHVPLNVLAEEMQTSVKNIADVIPSIVVTVSRGVIARASGSTTAAAPPKPAHAELQEGNVTLIYAGDANPL